MRGNFFKTHLHQLQNFHHANISKEKSQALIKATGNEKTYIIVKATLFLISDFFIIILATANYQMISDCLERLWRKIWMSVEAQSLDIQTLMASNAPIDKWRLMNWLRWKT